MTGIEFLYYQTPYVVNDQCFVTVINYIMRQVSMQWISRSFQHWKDIKRPELPLKQKVPVLIKNRLQNDHKRNNSVIVVYVYCAAVGFCDGLGYVETESVSACSAVSRTVYAVETVKKLCNVFFRKNICRLTP